MGAHRRIRLAAFTLGLVAITLAARAIDVPRLIGRVKGDEATYASMALSLAYDGDLTYGREDFERFQRTFNQGPEGIFLKRTQDLHFRFQHVWPPVTVEKTPLPAEQGLSFGKAFIASALAAPLVAIGGASGLLVFNALLLAICTWCAVRFCQARLGAVAGAVLGVAFIGASVVPVYGVWMTSEIFNFAGVLIGYFLWLYKRVAPPAQVGPLDGAWTDVAAAVLLGIASYSKVVPTGALAVPILLVALVSRPRRHFVAVTAAFILTFGGLFAANTVITGEWNYQGGERKSFYGVYPFDAAGTTFEANVNEMTTNDADTGMVLAPETLRLLPLNSWYFLVGRDAGLMPYYLPGVAIVLWWLLRIARSTIWQWATLLGLVASIGVLLVFFPFTWNGAGGPPGNRYILPAYGVMLYLLPAGRVLWAPLAVLAGGLAFTGAMVLNPFKASLEPWANVERVPLRWLPIELTIVDELPVRLFHNRSRIPFIRNPTVFLYYMDGNTYYAEPSGGFWIAGGAATDIVIRTDIPIARLQLAFTSRVQNTVRFRFGGREHSLPIAASGHALARITPGDPPTVHASYPYVLHLETTAGFVPKEHEPSQDGRNLGVFVTPTFMFGPRGEVQVRADPPKGGGG